MRLIIDCDTGVDDAQAIALALKCSEIELMAITCVTGNSDVVRVAENSATVLQACGVTDVPIFLGSSKPLLSLHSWHGILADAKKYHGEDGLGNSSGAFPNTAAMQSIVPNENAANALCRIVNENPGEVTVVAVGPLTNIALAMKLDEFWTSKLKALYIMGGAVHSKGNVTIAGEFNITMDPEAAAIVLSETVCPTYLMPWETTSAKGLNWDWHAEWVNHPSGLMQFLQKITAHTCEQDRLAWNTQFCPPDLVTMAFAIDNDMVTKSEVCYCYVDCGYNLVTRGQLIVDWRGISHKKANITVCLDYDTNRFKKVLERMISI